MRLRRCAKWAIAVAFLAFSVACSGIALGTCLEHSEDAARDSEVRKATPMTWLKLESAGGSMPSYQSLTIDTEGGVRAVLRWPRQNLYVGTFELVLTEERLAELREAVRRADLFNLKDDYPPATGIHCLTWVEIMVVSESNLKRVRATNESPVYPPGLKTLFDLKSRPLPGTGHPGGVLSRLISEVSAHPVAAIGVGIEVQKHSFRVGEEINAALVVKNVGKQPVVLPSLDCEEIARGYMRVELRHVPLPAEEMAEGLASAHIEFGPLIGPRLRGALSDRAKADLKNMVRIEPGGEWRIPMPKALVAPSSGEYELVGSLRTRLYFSHSIVEKELGASPVSGWTAPKPVRLTVVPE